MNETYYNYDVIHDHDILQQQEFEFLDSIKDLETYLQQADWSIHKIMDQIENNCGASYTKESSIFNCITADDFIEYLRKRYKGKYEPYYYMECRLRQTTEQDVEIHPTFILYKS